MKNSKSFQKLMAKAITYVVIASFLLTLTPAFNLPVAQAASNLIKGGSFENEIETYWGTWQKEDSVRSYELYRAYDAAFGYGSYSAAIDAKGASEEAFSAMMVSNGTTNKLAITAAKNYFIIFSAKASQPMNVITYLERADNYAAVTPFQARTLTTQWQKFIVNVTPNYTGDALISFVYGDMPDNTTLFIDGVQVVEADMTVNTKEIKGYIGDKNKFINITNITNFTSDDIEIELPYFNNLTGTSTTKRIHPRSLTSTGIYFDLEERTYAGIGRIYALGNYIGQFNYNILTKVTGYHPSLIRVDEDLVVYGNGFIPAGGNASLVVNTIDANKKNVQTWLRPVIIDSNLTQMTFKLPVGIVSGKMLVQTSFMNTDGKEVVNKSNSFDYKIKPVIYATNWSKKGYEQVGDSLKIYGKGMGLSPYVKFYDANNVLIETKKAKNIEITDRELIEVDTTKKFNTFSLTVLAGGVESDKSDSLRYIAKPKLTSIVSKYSRPMYENAETLKAAKIGDEITLNGEGFKANASSTASVIFQGVNARIEAVVAPENINANGTSLKVVVPAGAQNGYINIRVNGVDSNYLPMEIVPSLVATSPNPIVPGQSMTITANGVGENINLTKVYFNLGKEGEISVQPYAIDASQAQVVLYVNAPMAISNVYTTVNVQYDRWMDDGKAVLNVHPVINSASINMDNRILSVKGYGFSIYPKENILTFKLADENRTVTNPKYKILGVYPTEEGQEIRIQILNDYYFGYVNVQVGEYASNEANFGPVAISKIARRVEFVPSENRVMGVLYISGYNFGPEGGVLVGSHWAEVHYRSNFFIIAVVEQAYVNDNPVIVARPN